MGTKTSIAWTDSTWGAMRGCSRVSPGCGGAVGEGGCYAEAIAARFSGPGLPYAGLATIGTNGPRWTGAVRLVPERLADPLRWKRPRRIFVTSMSDPFHRGYTNEEIAAVFGVMAATPHHTYQLLTKRLDRALEWYRWLARDIADPHGPSAPVVCGIQAANHGADVDYLGLPDTWPLPNVHLIASTEDQKRLDERVPLLLQCPAAVRGISAEPLLGPLNLSPWVTPHGPRLDWVIVGGESGPGARPMNPAWVRSLRDQCAAAGTAFFFKQWGGWVPRVSGVGQFDSLASHNRDRLVDLDGTVHCTRDASPNGQPMSRVGKKSAGRLLDGRTWDEFPVARS